MLMLKVNGKTQAVEADESTPLLWVLREQLGMTGAKYGCGTGVCGACTVLIDGKAVRACVVPVSELGPDEEITTIEGLSADGSHPLQQSFAALDVPQCGYCMPGMVMSAVALLNSKPAPSDADIDAGITNICRCGAFNRVREGIHLAAKMNKRGKA